MKTEDLNSHSFELLLANKKVLEHMANNKPLNEILNSIVGLIETFASGCLSTAYFIVDGKLRLGAAPSWPESFVKTVDGCPIGENQGTCGHAAYTGVRAISTDVTKDEVWGPFRDWILSYGIQAAWSTPVISDDGQVLATVSMCWKEPRVPTERDLEVVDCATSLMKIAVNRKRQEDIITEQSLKLVASSKFAAVGEMSASLAHELNNPLAIIRGHANLLQLLSLSSKPSGTEVKAAADQIEKTVNRISGIIKGLKTISREGEHDPFETICLKDLVEETLSFCSERFKKSNVNLTFCTYKSELTLECRPVQISQAILNLLNNSFDAIQELKEKWIEINITQAQNDCIISITDSGKGISPDLQEKIMQPFFTTKKSCHGTGLGLSITKNIIESHQGELSINNQVAHTQFLLRLPLKQNACKRAALEP